MLSIIKHVKVVVFIFKMYKLHQKIRDVFIKISSGNRFS